MVAKLERVPLRVAFPSEVRDLSRWVKANIEEINAATGLSLANASAEQPAGDFSVDLIAEDDGGGKVVIENQIGKSDHDHLGKVLTYLSAHEAQAAVWIVEKPRVEHVNAIAWLNQSSSADFYLVKVEAFRIGNSDVAPLLTLITGPSPETKIIAEEKERFQARHHERERFWEGLLEVANKKTDLHAGRAASRDSFIGGPSGTAGITFNYVVRQHSGMVELWIGRGPERANENKEIFNKLFAQKEQIERDFGGPLDWQPLEDRKGCRIAIITEIGGYRDPDKWPQVFEWMTDKMVALHRALQSRVEALNL
ncbi:MAG: DUF4268 domain-containing protein [Rhizobiaceae bacterium]